MLKFLLYLLIFYFIIRFLRGLFQPKVIIKNYHYQNQPDNKQEGEMKIVKGPEKKNGGTKSDNLGEYVDYEDVK